MKEKKRFTLPDVLVGGKFAEGLGIYLGKLSEYIYKNRLGFFFFSISIEISSEVRMISILTKLKRVCICPFFKKIYPNLFLL